MTEHRIIQTAFFNYVSGFPVRNLLRLVVQIVLTVNFVRYFVINAHFGHKNKALYTVFAHCSDDVLCNLRQTVSGNCAKYTTSTPFITDFKSSKLRASRLRLLFASCWNRQFQRGVKTMLYGSRYKKAVFSQAHCLPFRSRLTVRLFFISLASPFHRHFH